jgi:hypothetical protein
MAKDSINVGPSPADEQCAQLGKEGYAPQAKKECRALINQLRRMYGDEPFGARLFIKAQAHDFGSYYEVECEFNSDSEEATEYAYGCENLPEKWDEEARKELGLTTA